jgi:hypothetical protein
VANDSSLIRNIEVQAAARRGISSARPAKEGPGRFPALRGEAESYGASIVIASAAEIGPVLRLKM